MIEKKCNKCDKYYEGRGREYCSRSCALSRRVCKEETKLKHSINKKGKKLSVEHSKKISLSLIGNKRTLGHHPEKETIEKIKKSNTGKKRTKESIERMRKSKIGRKRSPFSKEWKGKIANSNRGALGNNWRGGVTKIYFLTRGCLKYKQWRSDIFTRDKFKCVECGYNRGGNLEAHHLKTFASIIEEYNIKTLNDALKCEELWNINNGRTLCVPCHKKTETWGKKAISYIKKQ